MTVLPSGSFRLRFTRAQSMAVSSALELLLSREFSDAAVTVQLGACREEVRGLGGKMSGSDPANAEEVTLGLHELHIVHSALTAAAGMFLVNGTYFANEPFHIRMGFFREEFDSLALGIVRAVSDATATETA